MHKNDNNPVTKLLGRERCLQLAQYMVTEAEPDSIAALWINLDRFQQINHSFGYVGGDEVLSIIASRLDAAVGTGVHLAHMGADEFACLFYLETPQMTATLTQLVVSAIEMPVTLDDITLHPSARIGIATLKAGETAASLLQRADLAMRAARQQGQCWMHALSDIAASSDSQHAHDELAIESKLHRAIETGGLSLHYQPILNNDGTINAVEALMRCTVDGEALAPAEFIPVAERTGLIVRLGEWTQTQGALFARRLMEAGYDIKVAVNISRVQLLSPYFSQSLNSALIYAKLPAERLELELTESLFMDMSSTVQDNLCDARIAGVSLAIDDFGTGYSCLANLKDIHAAKLKLDRAFASALPHDPRAYAIVKAMTRLGQELGMRVVAEGVETEAQMNALRRAGVDAAQGHIYATAMEGDALMAWLHRYMSRSISAEYDHDRIGR